MNFPNEGPALVKRAPNPYLDKVIDRFIEASTALRDAAENMRGRGSVSEAGIEHVRVLAEAVSRSMDVARSITRHFPAELQADGGLGTDPGIAARGLLRDLHVCAAINGALAIDGATA